MTAAAHAAPAPMATDAGRAWKAIDVAPTAPRQTVSSPSSTSRV